MHRTRGESASREKCGNNLRQIGQAILLYANENKGKYPRTFYKPAHRLAFSNDASDGGTLRDPFGDKGLPGKVGDNEVVRRHLPAHSHAGHHAEVFVCPQSDGIKDAYGSAPGAGGVE